MKWKWGKGGHLFYEDIFQQLHKNKIKYLVIGGVAVNLYGIPRTTGDVDMMLAMDAKNISKFLAVAKTLGIQPKVPADPRGLADPAKLKEWKIKKNMKVFSFCHPQNPFICVDIMTEEYIPFADAYRKKKMIASLGIRISVVSVSDLVKLKKIAGRPQDLDDIQKLKEAGLIS